MKLQPNIQQMTLKILISAFIALSVSSAVYATTVYKWNEDGKTIYSQIPPPAGIKFEVITEKNISKPTSVAKAESSNTGSSFEQRREKRQQEKTEKEVLEESNRIKKENCAIAQNNMQSLSSRGQVTIKDGDIYRKLSEEERQSKIQEAQSNIKEYCQG